MEAEGAGSQVTKRDVDSTQCSTFKRVMYAWFTSLLKSNLKRFNLFSANYASSASLAVLACLCPRRKNVHFVCVLQAEPTD